MTVKQVAETSNTCEMTSISIYDMKDTYRLDKLRNRLTNSNQFSLFSLCNMLKLQAKEFHLFSLWLSESPYMPYSLPVIEGGKKKNLFVRNKARM